MNISAAVFIRNNNSGAFCLWESMAQLIPLVDEYVVYDFGSTDDTWETLEYLAVKNKKIRLFSGSFPVNPETGKQDAGSFATLANDVVSLCKNDIVIYHQADEIWHENLVSLMQKTLKETVFDEEFRGLSFWRYQLQENFQVIKWFPHLVNRVVRKGHNPFVGDGMNTKSIGPVCGNFDGNWFMKWDPVYKSCPYTLPTHEMILDVSRSGGFLGNITQKSTLHGPFWNENPNVNGVNIDAWYQKERENPNWHKAKSPFQIPEIMVSHLGEIMYQVHPHIIEKIVKG
jgi:glycosyltransferase involved in cell wall biosynthesis